MIYFTITGGFGIKLRGEIVNLITELLADAYFSP